MLMASNAYISKYKVVSSKKQDGLTVIQIEAIVEKLAVLKRMQPSNALIKSVDGESLAASIDTKNTDDDAKVQILAKILKDQNYPFSILEATAELNPEPVKRNGDSLEMEIKVTVQANYQKFDEFRKIIEPVLKKIAISESTTVIKDTNTRSFEEYLNQDKTAFCYINTSRNAKLTNCGYKAYKLSDKVAAILFPYARIIPAVDVMLCNANGDSVVTDRIAVVYRYGHYSYYSFAGVEQYSYTLTGYDHNKISQGATFSRYNEDDYPKHFFLQPFLRVDRNFLSQLSFIPTVKIESSELKQVKLVPVLQESVSFLQIDNKFSSQLFFTQTVKIESSELKQVKSVKCVVVSNCPPLDEVYQKLPETLKNWNPEREDK
jgi:hypothetical protein